MRTLTKLATLILLTLALPAPGDVVVVVGRGVSAGCTVVTNAITVTSAFTPWGNTSNSTFVVTPAFTPAASDTLILFSSFSPASTETVTNSGATQFTWWRVGATNYNTIGSPAGRLVAWVTQLPPGVSPFSMTVTISGITSGSGANVALFRISGGDTNLAWGSNAIAQVTMVGSNATANPRMSWSAPGNNGSNTIIYAVGDDINSASDSAPESGWTEPANGEVAYNTPAHGLTTGFRLTVPAATTFTTNTSTSRDWAAIALEVRAGTNHCVGPPPGSFDQEIANVLLTFESGSNGDPVTTNYMHTTDIGAPPFGAAWAVSGITGTVSTAYSSPFEHEYVIEGVTNVVGLGTRCVEFSHSAIGFNRFEFPEGSRTNPVTLYMDFLCTVPEPDLDSGAYDYVSLNHDGGGEFAVLASRDWEIVAHSSGTDGDPVVWHRETWFHARVEARTNDRAYITIYDTNYNVVGVTESVYISGNDDGIRSVEFGNIVPHGVFPSGSIFMDNVAVFWTTNVPPPPDPDCVEFAAETTDNDFWTDDVMSQSITMAGETICEFRAKLSRQGGVTRDVTCGIYDAPEGGSQIGSSSAPVSVNSDTPLEYTFTMPSVALSGSGTAYVRLSAGGTFRWRANSSGTYAGGNFYTSSTSQAAYDGVFSLREE